MKFLKFSLLLSAYILLWGVNSFSFASSMDLSEIQRNVQEIETHIIPLMEVDGRWITAQSLTEALQPQFIN